MVAGGENAVAVEGGESVAAQLAMIGLTADPSILDKDPSELIPDFTDSYGPDFMGDEADRAALASMNMVDREQVLSERSTARHNGQSQVMVIRDFLIELRARRDAEAAAAKKSAGAKARGRPPKATAAAPAAAMDDDSDADDADAKPFGGRGKRGKKAPVRKGKAAPVAGGKAAGKGKGRGRPAKKKQVADSDDEDEAEASESSASSSDSSSSSESESDSDDSDSSSDSDDKESDSSSSEEDEEDGEDRVVTTSTGRRLRRTAARAKAGRRSPGSSDDEGEVSAAVRLSKDRQRKVTAKKKETEKERNRRLYGESDSSAEDDSDDAEAHALATGGASLKAVAKGMRTAAGKKSGSGYGGGYGAGAGGGYSDGSDSDDAFDDEEVTGLIGHIKRREEAKKAAAFLGRVPSTAAAPSSAAAGASSFATAAGGGGGMMYDAVTGQMVPAGGASSSTVAELQLPKAVLDLLGEGDATDVDLAAPASLKDINRLVRLTRSQAQDHLSHPQFKEMMVGCFVRFPNPHVNIHANPRDAQAVSEGRLSQYRVARIVEVAKTGLWYDPYNKGEQPGAKARTADDAKFEAGRTLLKATKADDVRATQYMFVVAFGSNRLEATKTGTKPRMVRVKDISNDAITELEWEQYKERVADQYSRTDSAEDQIPTVAAVRQKRAAFQIMADNPAATKGQVELALAKNNTVTYMNKDNIKRVINPAYSRTMASERLQDIERQLANLIASGMPSVDKARLALESERRYYKGLLNQINEEEERRRADAKSKMESKLRDKNQVSVLTSVVNRELIDANRERMRAAADIERVKDDKAAQAEINENPFMRRRTVPTNLFKVSKSGAPAGAAPAAAAAAAAASAAPTAGAAAPVAPSSSSSSVLADHDLLLADADAPVLGGAGAGAGSSASASASGPMAAGAAPDIDGLDVDLDLQLGLGPAPVAAAPSASSAPVAGRGMSLAAFRAKRGLGATSTEPAAAV